MRLAFPNKCLAFHTAQLSDQSGDYVGQGLSWPNSSPISRCHLAPKFLWYCPSQRQQSLPGNTVCCAPLSPQRLQASRSLLAWDWLTCSKRGGSCKVTITDLTPPLLRCSYSSYFGLWCRAWGPQPLWSPAQGPGTFLLAYEISLLSVFKCLL